MKRKTITHAARLLCVLALAMTMTTAAFAADPPMSLLWLGTDTVSVCWRLSLAGSSCFSRSVRSSSPRMACPGC